MEWMENIFVFFPPPVLFFSMELIIIFARISFHDFYELREMFSFLIFFVFLAAEMKTKGKSIGER